MHLVTKREACHRRRLKQDYALRIYCIVLRYPVDLPGADNVRCGNTMLFRLSFTYIVYLILRADAQWLHRARMQTQS